MSEVLALGAVMAGMVFACAGCEMAAWMDSDFQFLGAAGGFVVGIVGAMLIIRWYLDHNSKPSESETSEEGTATDPDLYNVPDN
jgi:hypothetical protein